MAVLGDSEMIVGDGSGDPVAESGATLRTSIGVGTGDSPTFTGLTLSGDLTVQGADIDLTNAATDIDLVDNNASALSFDASGKTGILEIVSTDNAEQVKMSGALEVIGNVSGSATSTGSFGELKVTGNVGIEGVTSDTILDIDSNSVSHIVHIAGNGATQFSGSVDVTGSLNATTLTQGGVAIGDTVSGSFATKASVSGSFAQKTAVSSSFAQKSAVSSSFAQKTGVSGSIGLVTGLDTGTTVISGSATSTGSFAHISITSRISGSSTSTGSFGALEGDGSAITNLTSAAITSVANDAADRVFTMDGDGTGTAEANLTFDGTILSGSAGSTGSFGKVVAAGVLNATTLQHGGVIVPTGTAISSSFVEKGAVSASFAQKTGVSGSFAQKTGVSGSFAQKSAVSSSFAQKSGVSGSFILQSALSGSSTVISGSAASTGSFGQLEVAGDVAIEGATANTLLDIDSDSVSHIVHVAGNGATQLSGSLKVTGSIGTSGNVTPSADNSIDLGAASYRWANVYTADLHLNNEGNPNTIDGTTGNWTVKEGEDYIYIVNNKSNKKFKLMLEEID